MTEQQSHMLAFKKFITSTRPIKSFEQYLAPKPADGKSVADAQQKPPQQDLPQVE